MLGLDVSKETLACALMDPSTRQVRWEGVVPNNAAGIARLLCRTPADVAWVLEPTGRYSLGVAKAAKAAGRTVLLAPPKRAKKYLQSLQERAKTDRLDARGLGLYSLNASLSPYPIQSEAAEKRQQLLAARAGLSQALASLKQRIVELPHAAEPLAQAVAELQAQLRRIDRQLRAETKQWPAMEQLQAVHGIGPVTAATVALCLASRQFESADAFVAYVGLDVAVRQSGKRKGSRGLTREGDAELRRLLYLAAQASLRAKGSPFRQQYQREREKGLASTAAICAVARKLARLCWALVHRGTPYDPNRVYRRP